MTLDSTTKRGYGTAHQKERKRWARILQNEGALPCPRCAKPIRHGETWDLGHTDDRTAWTGPEHIPCNRSAGGRNGAKKTNQNRGMTIREW